MLRPLRPGSAAVARPAAGDGRLFVRLDLPDFFGLRPRDLGDLGDIGDIGTA
jgi:hypothetical protein